ncbi:MAG: hypothetical protein A4E52_02211 [Pelotomaculum sp. PtaB.Bin013]|uniref:Selenium-dependent hydroxylase accessory protein YqeC n=1 Tax=Pelotomaculum isophthalicicum JI TaxID=947010 RepID=A0A9X4JUS2_9FIRM|nr:selenium cofactor biosynthesis protein YqeC [Pelotomaculum isophthalicicum]MDF9406851.1 putative selenium-dependent hydroxylase accessory protein YqeC [Pelotomaculum isophthalicicum JI]OPX81413.1 MAG: hypothetical protein A4E52_02211 [Pelotomaculum sp. PtaB.Bin013]
MELIDAFPLRKGDIIALVGAGGKTTTMFAIGVEAKKRGWKVILTTTTRIFCPREEEGQELVIEANPERLLTKVKEKLALFPLLVVGTGLNHENKLLGIGRELVAALPRSGADLIVVEADGAAHKPFKAPREGEPVIPDSATLVVPIVGIDCLGKPLDMEHTHRPEKIAGLTGMNIDMLVTGQVVARVLLHSHGYRKDIPPRSRWVPYINKVESTADLSNAREIAGLLGEGGAKRVAIGAARAAEPVKEVLTF